MKAVLQKINAEKLDKSDSLQFRVEGEEVDEELLEIRRGDKVKIKAEGLQTSMKKVDEDGVVIDSDFIEFESATVSISIAVGEKDLIATITVGCEDKDIAKQALNKNLRGVYVNLSFSSP